MNFYDVIAAVATSLGVITFAAIFTILYSNYVEASVRELQTGKRDIELIDEYVYSEQKAVKLRRRIWSIVKSVAFYGLLILLIPVFLFSLISNLQNGVPMIGNHALMVVASGSMSEKNSVNAYLSDPALMGEYDMDNQFGTYSVILLERVDETDLKLYDVIAFRDGSGKNVIHRIVKLHADGSFETRGDSNNASDAFRPRGEDILGRYTGTSIPLIGSFVMFFQSIGGIVTLLALLYCLVMLDRFNARIVRVEQERLGRLLRSIDLDMTNRGDAFRAEFRETLYYKGYAYFFDENGFVGKDEIHDAAYLEKSDTAAIRVVDSNGCRTETELPIKSEEGNE